MKTKISAIRNGKSCVMLTTMEQFIKCFGEPKKLNWNSGFEDGFYHGIDGEGDPFYLVTSEVETLYPLDTQRCNYDDIDWEEEVVEVTGTTYVDKLEEEIERLKAENEQLKNDLRISTSQNEINSLKDIQPMYELQTTTFNLDNIDRLAWEILLTQLYKGEGDIEYAYKSAEQFQLIANQRKENGNK